MVPPPRGHELRQHDRHVVAGTRGTDLLDILQQRLHQGAIGRLEHDERDALSPFRPLCPQSLGLGRIEVDVNRAGVGRQRLGVVERHDDGALDAADRHEDRVAAWPLRAPALERELCSNFVVVAPRQPEEHDVHGNQQQDDPRPFVRLGHRHDHQHDTGDDRSQPVDEGVRSPPGSAEPAPPDDHAGLGQRERHEHTDHVERDEGVRVATEDHEQDAGEYAQSHDAVREGEAVSLAHELARDVAVTRQDRRQAREVGVGRVRRQHQDHHRRGLDCVVPRAAVAEHPAGELGDHRLLFAREHVIRLRQQCDPEEHRDRKSRHHRHRRRRVFRFWRFECRDTVGDRFHPGHRRAAVREGREEQEQRQRLAHQRHRGGRRDRVNGARQRVPRSHANQDQGRHDEEIGGDGEDVARLANAPEIADHQQEDEAEGELDAIDVPLRKRRRERRDSGCDADGHGEDVVDQERRSRDERRQLTEVLFRDDVGAAAARVRMDRLAIRKDDDREDERDHQSNGARDAQRGRAGEDEHAHDFLGRVRHRRERVRRQDSQAGDLGQPLVVSEVGRDRPADDEAFDLRKKTFFGHNTLPRADGVSWRARGWKSSTESRVWL